MEAPKRKCTKCKELKDFETEYYVNKRCKGGRARMCKECYRLSTRRYFKGRHDNPVIRLIDSCRNRSYTEGTTHAITEADLVLPETCPYLGIKLDYRRASEKGQKRTPDAASVDRIDPTKGYVPGNVQVISDLANRMKQDATVEELLAFADGVLRVHGPPSNTS